MRSRNCNLELRLVPPSPCGHFRDELGTVGEELKLTQQLTIFYDRRVSVCDVTELQAREIIKLASEEVDDRLRKTTSSPASTTITTPSPSSSPLMSGNQGGLSMKRSLQRFLQKRKHRIQASSPYHP